MNTDPNELRAAEVDAIIGGQTRANRAPREQVLQQAQHHLQEGKLNEAGALFQSIVNGNPRDEEALFGVATVLGKLGVADLAKQKFRQAIALNGGRLASYVGLANQALISGDIQLAETAARRAIELDGTNGDGYRVLAHCQLSKREYDQARASAEKALQLDPSDLNADLLVAMLQRRQSEWEPAKQRLQRLVEASPSFDFRSRVSRELGRVLDATGEFAEAFRCFEEAGAAMAHTAPARRVDPNWHLQQCGHAKDAIPKLDLPAWSQAMEGQTTVLPPPNFLVGFPRSGTTLTEQILAAHPQVMSTDELQIIPQLKHRILTSMGHYDLRAIAKLDGAQIGQLRQLYWTIASEAGVNLGQVKEKTFIDKMPLNLIDIGLINLVFPQSKVLVALRDPRDVCLSCFMQPFQLNPAMMNFLQWERTGLFYSVVMEMWLAVKDHISLKWLPVRYEETVGDLERQARQMLAFLELEFDPAVLKHHESAQQKFISTPSFETVVEPVHGRAIGRWKNYAEAFPRIDKYLQPIVAALGYEQAAGDSGTEGP